MAHQRLPINIRLESFEGPLDLLLYLIQSNEMDISRISISHVTDQYLAYILMMQELNFDIASEFLVMAATLIHWKSKAILPKDEDEQGPEDKEEDELTSKEALILQLLEHQRFLAAGDELSLLPRLNDEVFAKNNSKPPIERIWREMNVTDLALSYQQSLNHSRKRNTVLRKETVSLSDKILEMGERLEVGRPTSMRDLLSELAERPETVVTFLASLELSRLKKLRLSQLKAYDPIYLELLENIRGLSLDLDTSFAEPKKDSEELA
jgi:segregation and condensation protein A